MLMSPSATTSMRDAAVQRRANCARAVPHPNAHGGSAAHRQAEISKLRADVAEQKDRVRETRTLLQAATNDAERRAARRIAAANTRSEQRMHRGRSHATVTARSPDGRARVGTGRQVSGA